MYYKCTALTIIGNKMKIRTFIFAALLCMSTGFTAYAESYLDCVASCEEKGGSSDVCGFHCT